MTYKYRHCIKSRRNAAAPGRRTTGPSTEPRRRGPDAIFVLLASEEIVPAEVDWSKIPLACLNVQMNHPPRPPLCGQAVGRVGYSERVINGRAAWGWALMTIDLICAAPSQWLWIMGLYHTSPPPPVEIHIGNICLFCLSHVCTEGCRRTRRRNMDSHYYESTDLQVLFDTFLTHSNLIIHQLMMIRLNRLGNKFHWMGAIIVSAALDWLKYSIKSKTNQIWHRIQTKTKINRIC